MAYQPYERGFSLGHRDSLRGMPMEIDLSWSLRQQQGYRDGYYAGSRALASRSWAKSQFEEREEE